MDENCLFFSKEVEESVGLIFSEGNHVIVPGITFDAGIGMVFSCRGTDSSVLYARIGKLDKQEIEECAVFDSYRNEKGELLSIPSGGKVYVEKDTLEMIDGDIYEKITLAVFSQEEDKITLIAKLI